MYNTTLVSAGHNDIAALPLCLDCGKLKINDLLEDKLVCANMLCRAFDIVTWLEVQ